jgi:integrase
MRKAHPNLVYIPATKDRKGREKPAHWQTEITVNYKRVRRYAGATKEEALIYLGELRKAAKEGKLDELIRPAKALPGTTFGVYSRALLDSAEWKQKRSHRRDETSLDALNKAFKNVPLAEMTSGAVRMYMTRRVNGDGLRPGTVNRELSLLKSILYAAEFDNIIPSNPIRGRRVKRLQEDNNREQHILEMHITDDQLRKLVDAGGEWFGVVLRLAVELGMRQGEILKAEWRDFNLALRTLRVRKENAKSKEERTIPLGPGLAVAIDTLPRIGQYIFSLPDGGRRQDVRKPFLAACKAAGLKTSRAAGICFHDLRHFAASRLVKVTDVVTAQKILGWKTLDMVRRYVHPTDEDKRLAVEAVEVEFFPVAGRQKDVNDQNDRAKESPAALTQNKRIQ